MNDENKVSGDVYISELIFNGGDHVDIKKGDIVVFVGPNNAGKSQSLKDILELCRKNINSVVISDVKITKQDISLIEYLNAYFPNENHGDYATYKYMNHSVSVGSYDDSSFCTEDGLRTYTDFFVANLDTSARLTICRPPQNVARDANYDHPIQYAAFNPEYRKWLSKNFRGAFGIDLIPNTQYGGIIPLCAGEPVKLEGEFSDEQSRTEEYAEILSRYEQVQKQGDGVKSFTGILLYLMLKNYRIYLMDEPESFLHPPQATMMGRIIGESLSESQQAFISTHSEDLIKGLSEVCPNRVKIIRITRDNNVNKIAILDSGYFEKIWTDPILRYSNIMSSLFHKNVVLCESDSDCKMYSIVDSFLKKHEGKYPETLFIHCGGKYRIAKIASALLSLGIDVKLIIDLDIFNNKAVLRGVANVMGIEWDEIDGDYNIIASNFSGRCQLDRANIKAKLNEILDSERSKKIPEKELKKLRSVLKDTSKWDILKRNGASAIPNGDATKAFEKINERLAKHNIFIVKEGEIENFVKEVGGHGPEWVDNVISQYPNLESSAYNGIKEFVRSLNI